MRVLVVGGAGYIGSHAVRALVRRGHDVRVYDNLSTGHRFLVKGLDLVVGDIGDEEKLTPALRGIDAVMNFAALASVGQSMQQPRTYFRNNVEGGLCLLNEVMEAGIRHFIQSSTCAVYGIPPNVPIREETPRQPFSPYGTSKLFFEHALEAYAEAYAIRFVSFRYFNAAGADESGEIGELHNPETHLIPSILQAAIGSTPEVEIYGTDYPTPDGTCIRDYIHVNDLAEAHALGLEYLADGGGSTALNLGTGTGNSVKEVVTTVERIIGRQVKKKIGPRRPGDPPVLVADACKAKQVLGWKASRDLENIISSAWAWSQYLQCV
jgi:UDP-glucose-4-epimerase GalE